MPPTGGANATLNNKDYSVCTPKGTNTEYDNHPAAPAPDGARAVMGAISHLNPVNFLPANAGQLAELYQRTHGPRWLEELERAAATIKKPGQHGSYYHAALRNQVGTPTQYAVEVKWCSELRRHEWDHDEAKRLWKASGEDEEEWYDRHVYSQFEHYRLAGLLSDVYDEVWCHTNDGHQTGVHAAPEQLAAMLLRGGLTEAEAAVLVARGDVDGYISPHTEIDAYPCRDSACLMS